MNTTTITRQSVKEKEQRILKAQIKKGTVSLSYIGNYCLFTENKETEYGRTWHYEATTKSCTCQVGRMGYVCRHIEYLRQGNNMLDMSVEF